MAGTTLVDTTDTMIVFETALEAPALRRPVAGAHRSAAAIGDDQLLQLQGVRDLLVGGASATAVVDDVAWSYEDPLPESLPIRGYFSFDATKADVAGRDAGVRGDAVGCGCEV